MGNTDSVVVQKRLSRFRVEERPVVEGVFDRLYGTNTAGVPGKAGKVLTLDMLKSCMDNIASDSMMKRVYAGMCSMDIRENPLSHGAGVSPLPHGAGVSREQLVVFLADVLRGTAEERAPLVMAMTTGTGNATCDQIIEFLQDLVSAVVDLIIQKGWLQGWNPNRMGDRSVGVKLLAEQMSSELKPSDQGTCDVTCLEDWLLRVSNVARYMELLVDEGLNVGLPSRLPPTLLPPCWETPWGKLRCCLLDLPLLMFLTPHLPDGYTTPWKLLFSTRLHGESFTKIVGSCRGRGPTVLLIKDTKGHMFGGFASQSWEVKPKFQGDSRCLLFSVFPCLRVYTCTGYNDHYMYLNQGQQTMPNGLGMGGQHGYFGLWLDSDFGLGHSRARPRCTTFGSPILSAEEDFTVESLEVWGVRKPPQEEEGETRGKRSILDADPEAQAMLEMTGKTLHSRGFREPEEEEGVTE